MARKKFIADFETTTDPNDCRVWAYGWMEIGKFQNYKIGNNMDEFMDWLLKCNGDVYFHNLKFDGVFIVNYLLAQGWKHNKSGQEKTFHTIISNTGQWYMIDIGLGFRGKHKKHVVVYDSLKKLPFTVANIGKSFELDVLKLEQESEFYERERAKDHELTEIEKQYVMNDIEVVGKALQIQFEQGLEKMTIGSDSLSEYKSIISEKQFKRLFPVFSLEMNEKIRKSYKGGFTWFNKRYEGKTIHGGLVYDVNSLYPAMMYNKKLPYGEPIYYDGKYIPDRKYDLYIQHIRCMFVVKKDHVPTIQIKKKMSIFAPNEYLESSKGEIVDLYLTSVDLELFLDHYETVGDIEYIGGWKFKSATGLFKQYIDKWSHIKQNSEGAIQLLAKLMLNNLYGKFATNPDVTGKVPYLKEDGSVGLRTGEQEYKDPVYTPMGSFITAYARELTIRTAQACWDRVIYCDTDSLHLEGTETPEAIKDIIDPKKLGYWDHETTFIRGKYLRQKTYILEYMKEDKETGEEKLVTKVVCAGMPDRIKEKVDFESFEIGFTSETGKLTPKRVKGGVVLIDGPFTLKG